MQKWEYRILHMPTTSVSVLNERVNNEAKDGWEPFLMSGNEYINVILRRPVESKGEQQD